MKNPNKLFLKKDTKFNAEKKILNFLNELRFKLSCLSYIKVHSSRDSLLVQFKVSS